MLRTHPSAPAEAEAPQTDTRRNDYDPLKDTTIDAFYPRQQPRQFKDKGKGKGRRWSHSQEGDLGSRTDNTSHETRAARGGQTSTRALESRQPIREEDGATGDATKLLPSMPMPTSEGSILIRRLLSCLLDYLGVSQTTRPILESLIFPLVNGFEEYVRDL